MYISILQNTNRQRYHNREQFLSDVELILENCIQYNGKESNFSATAQTIVDTARQALDEVRSSQKKI